ncbi:hypothetical protein QLX08_006423 [Tetragonisca angustula]|uniref:TGF-beta family profile domain-containing protein n=1 Tax=Tetragonisca angustula TaxID=166442 RepID=A0AAW0ZU27_9HYME
MHKIHIIDIIFILIIFPINCEKLSGFYVDNGFNRTIIVKAANNKEKENIEHTLLNILELPNKPRIRGSLIKNSASTFLLSIYKNMLTSNGESNQEDIDEHNLSNNIINIIGQSDLIMTFNAQNAHSGNPSEINYDRRIWFDLSEIPKIKDIMATELRLYQNLDKNVDHNKVYKITAYRIARKKNGRRIRHYINSVKTAINGGWISLNISQALEHWIKFPKENYGLFLAIYTDHNNHIRIPKLKDIGIVGISGIPDKQPFLVIFFKRFTFIVDHSGTHEITSKQKRSIEFGKQHHNQSNASPRGNMCKINSLYVSFKDLQLQDWIVAPTGYNAYYCSGGCSFPTTSNITNHAVIQSLIHCKRPDEIPNPCCVPTKLSPISVIHFVDDNNIALKKLKNMVVDNCGCR